MCGSLCDAILGGQRSGRVLARRAGICWWPRQPSAEAGPGVLPGLAGQLRSKLATIKAGAVGTSSPCGGGAAAPAAAVHASLVPGDRRAVAVSSDPAET